MHNSLRNFNYIIYSSKAAEAIFIDPYDLSITRPAAETQGLTPKYLINTHDHHDHIKNNEEFLGLPGTEHIVLKDGEKLELAPGDYIQAIATPGHKTNHQCFKLFTDNQFVALISGDTLFNAGVGNCKNGGNVEDLYHSIQDIIQKMPDDILIYPAHDYFLTNLKFALTIDPENQDIQDWIAKRSKQDLDHEFEILTLGEERKINPFLRLNSEYIKDKYNNKSDKEIFFDLRAKRDHW